jgi:hypothetical protein
MTPPVLNSLKSVVYVFDPLFQPPLGKYQIAPAHPANASDMEL